MAAKKSASKKKTSTKGQKKVGKVMHEFKHGQLKSGGRKKVTSRKQAIAIGLSEARRSGAKVAPKKSSSSSSSKKSTSKSSGSKKTASKKSTGRKSSAKKSSSRKSSAKKS